VTSFAVDVSSLAGFKMDLEDLKTNFSSNASRLLPGVTLPAGTGGLMAMLAPAFQKFSSAITSAQQTDLSIIGTLASDLTTAATRYRETDDRSAAEMGTLTSGAAQAASRSDDSANAKRFSGLQLPTLSEVQESQYTVRQVVTTANDQIKVYDDALSAAIGVKPAADYLTPLVADWEALQAIGKRIGWLGINDYVASDSLVNGTKWLQSSWSGDAAQSFGSSADTLGQSISGRSADLDAVSKIVENGGAVLERLVYNQAVGLSGDILKSMTFVEATFPLGVWAQLVSNPMQESIRSQIASALDALKKSAESRQNAITTMIEKISKAADYTPGRTAPTYNSSEFEVPDKVVADPGASKYGFGDNTWWEETNASA
jgi:uncharacterized protein YukE